MARINFNDSVGGNDYRRPFYVSDVAYEIDLATGTFKTTVQVEDIPNVRWNYVSERWEWYVNDAWTWTVYPTGKRVLVCGTKVNYPDSGDSSPCAWWCGDVFADTPTWTEVSTGLPTIESATRYAFDVKQDPNTPARAYLRIGTDGDYSWDGCIYYNSDWLNGNSWTEVLSSAEARALVVGGGIPDGEISGVAVDDFSIGADGDVYVYIYCRSDGGYFPDNRRTLWIAKSTNQGSTWSITKYWDTSYVTGSILSQPRHGVWADPTSADVIWTVATSNYATGTCYLHKSTNGGTSFTDVLDTGGYSTRMQLAKRTLETDEAGGLHIPEYFTTTNGPLYHVVNGTMTSFGTNIQSQVDGLDWLWDTPQVMTTFFAGFEITAPNWSYKTTTDGGTTWSTTTASNAHKTFAGTSWQGRSEDTPHHYAAQDTGSTTAVWYTDDFITFNDVGSSSWSSSYRFRGIMVDARV